MVVVGDGEDHHVSNSGQISQIELYIESSELGLQGQRQTDETYLINNILVSEGYAQFSSQIIEKQRQLLEKSSSRDFDNVDILRAVLRRKSVADEITNSSLTFKESGQTLTKNKAFDVSNQVLVDGIKVRFT